MINEAGCTVYKFADVGTSGTALDRIAAGKRQMFGSGGAGAAWVMGTKCWAWNLFCGAVDELIAEEMNGAGGDGGNGLKLFATGILACGASACGGEEAKRSAGGVNGKCGCTGFGTGDGGLVILCVLVAD